MMWLRVILGSACAVVAWAGDQYTVPAPNIEAFSPKGLRISIPDSPDIKSVQFFLRFDHAVVDNDPGTVAKEVDDKQGSHWIYYNPSVVIKPGDYVHYKIIVKNNNGLPWSRQGSYPINRVLSLADSTIGTDCDEEGQQFTAFPSVGDIDEPGLSSTTGSKQQVKSAYSMFKSMETKPITRSSTTTTSGSFYVKPTGDVEASGYKSSSSFDSTRQDGEQWQHSKSELTAAEIEELTRIHGQDFRSMPAFSHLQNSGSGGSSYRQSSYSSTSQSRPISYGSSYHQTGQIGQLSQTSDLASLTRAPLSGYSSYSKYEKHETVPTIVNPVSTSYSTSESLYGRRPVKLSVPPVDQSLSFSDNDDIDDTQSHISPLAPPSYSSVQTNYHRKESVQSSGPVQTGYPVSGGTTSSKKTETHQYQAPSRTVTIPIPVTTVPRVAYNGDIFRSTIRAASPQSCSNANYDYKTQSQVDVVALEKSVQEVQCLAVLAENTMKAEVYALKEANTNLVSKFHELQEQFQRFREECKCGY